MGRCRGKCSGSEYDDDTGCIIMQSGIKEKDEKDKKKQDVKYPDYWDGNIYICGSIFIYGSGNFYCSLPWNLREKGVYYKYKNNKENNMKQC